MTKVQIQMLLTVLSLTNTGLTLDEMKAFVSPSRSSLP